MTPHHCIQGSAQDCEIAAVPASFVALVYVQIVLPMWNKEQMFLGCTSLLARCPAWPLAAKEPPLDNPKQYIVSAVGGPIGCLAQTQCAADALSAQKAAGRLLYTAASLKGIVLLQNGSVLDHLQITTDYFRLNQLKWSPGTVTCLLQTWRAACTDWMRQC